MDWQSPASLYHKAPSHTPCTISYASDASSAYVYYAAAAGGTVPNTYMGACLLDLGAYVFPFLFVVKHIEYAKQTPLTMAAVHRACRVKNLAQQVGQIRARYLLALFNESTAHCAVRNSAFSGA